MNQNIFTTDDEQGIVDHMNDDHSSSLVHYCHLLGMSHITEKDKVVMNGIDMGVLHFIFFHKPSVKIRFN